MEKLIAEAKKIGFNKKLPTLGTGFINPYDAYIWMCKLQKWLRDEHKVNSTINPSFTCFNIVRICKYDEMEDVNEDMALNGLNFKDYKSYEDALEVALYESIKFLEE